MAYKKYLTFLISAIILMVLIAFPRVLLDYFLEISVLFMIASFLPYLISFSRKRMKSRELVVIAILGAIAAVGRIPFSAIPSVQPTTFVVIVSGMALGPQSGFVVGTLSALVSNLVLGQGPWTPWQMYAWGMIGLTAGLLRNTFFLKNRIGLSSFGFVTGILFGWVMNLWFVLGVMQEVNWGTIAAYYGASLTFDVMHGVFNVILLYFFGATWIKMIQRFRTKYGLFEFEA
ncbi:ECF transporter S component [Bacillaceae bacterium S4-13-58]